MSESRVARLKERLRVGGGRHEADSDPGWHQGLWFVLLVDAALVFLMPTWLSRSEWFGSDRGVWFAFTVSALGIWNFVGFFARTGEIRSALAASVFIVWIVLFAFTTNVPAFRDQLEGNAFVESTWDLFNRTVAVVMGFYFTTEAGLQGIRLWQGGKTLRTQKRLEDPQTRAAEEEAEKAKLLREAGRVD